MTGSALRRPLLLRCVIPSSSLQYLTRLNLAEGPVGRGRRKMGPSRVPDGGRPSVDDAAELRGAALFKLIWDCVADVLGTTATATLVRRAARRAMLRSPELA